MLKRYLETVIATCQSVSVRWEALPEPPVIDLPRPVWDNGTDYDIPTFIRRNRAAGRRPFRAQPGHRPLFRGTTPVGRRGGQA
jgi:hypothetical protein